MAKTSALRATCLLALGVALAACEDSTAPEITDTLDTDAALADYEALETAFGSSSWASFQALGNRTPFAGSPASLEVVGALGSGRESGFAAELANRLAETSSGVLAGPARGPIISGWHRGTTFVYDPAADDYTPDLTRTDAPETGVRFVLYEVDSAGYPVLEQERGYADLVDEGDGSTEDIVLRLVVVLDGSTALDYRTSLDHDATSGALTVDGFLNGDGVRLDFAIVARAEGPEESARLDVDFDIGVDARSFSIEGEVRGVSENEDDGNGSVDITVRHRTNTLRVDMTGEAGVLDGAVYLDESLFATVTGPEADPTFLGADGDPLRHGEILVLFRVVDVVEDVFDFLEDLIDPVNDLVLLGFIL